jgi:hypothetical protein
MLKILVETQNMPTTLSVLSPLPLISLGRLPYLGLHCRKDHKRQVSDDCSDFRRRLNGTSLCRRVKDVLYKLYLYGVFEFCLSFSLQPSEYFARFTICNGPTNALVCIKTLIQMSHTKTF